WPSDAEVQALLLRSIDSQMFRDSYASVFKGDDNWANIKVPAGQRYAWDARSTYVKNPPYFDAMDMTPPALRDVRGARALAVLGGREYGTGSSRDWAAKGTMLLGVRAVIAESFERIHRSNLIGMGVAPLQFLPGQSVASLRLTGREVFDITGLSRGDAAEVTVSATPQQGKAVQFTARLRIDTPKEREYYRHGG